MIKPQIRVILGYKNSSGPDKSFVKEGEAGRFEPTEDVFEATDYENLDAARAAVEAEMFPNAYQVYDLTLTPTLRKVPDDET